MAIVIGAVIAIVVYLKQKPCKQISWRVSTQERLLNVGNELRGKLKIFYESKEIEDVSLFVIEVSNSGNKEILESDYIEPVTIFFGQNSRILSSEITKFKPSYFKITPVSDEKTITLSKTVFNAGESITLKALVSKPEFYSVSGRIAGGKIVQNIPTTQSPNFWSKTGIAFAIISIVGMILSASLNQVVWVSLFAVMFFTVFIMVFIFIIIVIASFVYSKIKHEA